MYNRMGFMVIFSHREGILNVALLLSLIVHAVLQLKGQSVHSVLQQNVKGSIMLKQKCQWVHSVLQQKGQWVHCNS